MSEIDTTTFHVGSEVAEPVKWVSSVDQLFELVEALTKRVEALEEEVRPLREGRERAQAHAEAMKGPFLRGESGHCGARRMGAGHLSVGTMSMHEMAKSNAQATVFWSGRDDDGDEVRSDVWSEDTMARTCVVSAEYNGHWYVERGAWLTTERPDAEAVERMTSAAVSEAVSRLLCSIASGMAATPDRETECAS